MIQRAQTDGVCGIVVWFADVDKQSAIADLCKQNRGCCYFFTGVHPDNIDRTNKKSHELWLEKVEECGRQAECVGLISGLNLQREIGTHFAQESLLRASCPLADKLQLPLIIHCPDFKSLTRALEILTEEGFSANTADPLDVPFEASMRRVLVHDAITASGGSAECMGQVLAAGWFPVLSAAGFADPDEAVRARARACARLIPPHRLLTCTDSPWKTPQNIPDTYLRTLRNEPCNLPFVNLAVAEAIGWEGGELSLAIRANALKVLGLEFAPMSQSVSARDVGGGDKLKPLVDSLPAPPVSTTLSPVQYSDQRHDHDDDDDDGHKNDDAVLEILEDKMSQIAVTQKGVDEPGEAARGDETATLVETGNNEESCGPSGEGHSLALASGPQPQVEHSGFYGCVKCRARLFGDADVATHGLDAARTVFKVGEEGLCKSVLFVSLSSSSSSLAATATGIANSKSTNTSVVPGAAADTSQRKKGKSKENGKGSAIVGGGGGVGGGGPALTVVGNVVECGSCGVKLGKHCSTEAQAACACGALMDGRALPLARVLATKVDHFSTETQHMGEEELRELARGEVEKVQWLAALEGDGGVDPPLLGGPTGRKSKKKSKMCSLNKGNFSSFRNKSFVPNASRSAAASGAGAGAGGPLNVGPGSTGSDGEVDGDRDAGVDAMGGPGVRKGGGGDGHASRRVREGESDDDENDASKPRDDDSDDGDDDGDDDGEGEGDDV